VSRTWYMLRFLKGPCPQRLIFITEARCCSFNGESSEAVAFPKGYATDACGGTFDPSYASLPYGLWSGYFVL
jgi:hypothetical protein